MTGYKRCARRDDLTAATSLVRLFREQPTPELADSARRGLTGALSANDRLRHTFHRLASYLIVPLFALANAGIVLNPHSISVAVTAPITSGIFLAYVFGKPIAVVGASWLITLVGRGRIRPQVGWAAVLGSGTIAGVAFTVPPRSLTGSGGGPEPLKASPTATLANV